MLIVQNRRDPITGWEYALGLRAALGRRAAMVTQEAGGHGVYPAGAGTCAAHVTTTFLITGALPDRDRSCPA